MEATASTSSSCSAAVIADGRGWCGCRGGRLLEFLLSDLALLRPTVLKPDLYLGQNKSGIFVLVNDVLLKTTQTSTSMTSKHFHPLRSKLLFYNLSSQPEKGVRGSVASESLQQ